MTLLTQNISPPCLSKRPVTPNTSSFIITADAGSSLRTKTLIIPVISSRVTIFPPLLVRLTSKTMPTIL